MSLKPVPAPLDAIESLWVDPTTLTPNPLNWKLHPKEQIDVVDDSVDKHGWLLPFLFNKRTGLLVNGHARLEIAVMRGYPSVPVWVGDFSEEDEAEILLTLDESAKLAESDAGKVHALAQRIKSRTGPLSDLIARVKADTGADGFLARTRPKPAAATPPGDEPEFEEVDRGDEDEPSRPPSTIRQTRTMTPDPAPPSVPSVVASAPEYNVRMVQLFLNTSTFGLFRLWVDALARKFETTSDTETVMKALEFAYGDILGPASGGPTPLPSGSNPE